MPQIHTSKAARLWLLLPMLLASVVLTACGGSSKSSSTATASASASATTGSAGSRSGRFTALRECLKKNGITLPAPTPGQRGGGFLGGAGRLPAGVTRAQFEAAVKKCGGLPRGGFNRRGSTNPAFRQALAKFATCMRQNGVNVPEPNTSGRGPIFNTAGLNASSPKFKAAETKCRSILRSALGGAGGAPGGGAGTGAA